MPTTIVNGCTTHYEVLGAGAPLVLIPGGRAPMSSIRPLAERMADQYRVIIYDRRNCGASDVIIQGEEAEQAMWADDLVQLLRQLDIDRAYIGGGSAGARVSLLTALRHPDILRGLILWSVSGGTVAARNLGHNYYDQFVEIAEKEGMEGVANSPFFAERIQQNPSNRERLLGMDAGEFIRVMKKWREFFHDRTPVVGASEAELRTIQAPTLVIRTDDDVHPATACAAVIDNVSNCESHPAMWTQQDYDRWFAMDTQLASRERADILSPILHEWLARTEARVGARA